MIVRSFSRVFSVAVVFMGALAAGWNEPEWLVVSKAGLDPETHDQLIEVTNQSPWNVTAYTVEVTVLFEDGSTEVSLLTTDLSWRVSAESGSVGHIRPGESYSPTGVTVGSHPSATDLTAMVVAVVFDDCRFAGEEEIVKGILLGREGLRLAWDRTLRGLEEVRNETDNPEQMRKRLKALAISLHEGLFRNDRISKAHRSMDASIKTCADNVEGLAKRWPDERLAEGLELYISAMQAELGLWRPHVTHDVDAKPLAKAQRVASAKDGPPNSRKQ